MYTVQPYPVPSRTDFAQSDQAVRLASVLREASLSNWRCCYLILIRGLPGSGKSTLAKFLVQHVPDNVIASVDEFLLDASQFTMPVYRSDLLAEANAACKMKVWSAIQSGVKIVVVDNENLASSDMQPYVDEAVKRDYSIHLVEPNTPWRYCPRKLQKYTSKRITLNAIQNMLAGFDRDLLLDDMLSETRQRLRPFMSASSSQSPKMDAVSIESNPTERQPNHREGTQIQPEEEQYFTADEQVLNWSRALKTSYLMCHI